MARSTLPHTIREALAAAGARLTGLADGSPRLEAELLLAEATGLSRTQLLTRGKAILAADAGQRYAVLVNRRVQGEPIAYIIGQQGFWTLDLDVSAATLIPRPETELLVELALARLPVGVSLVVADLGTGSGAVAAALAYERPDWTLVATDRSVEAIRVARANARRLGLANLRTLAGDWLDAFAPNSLDAVLGNPPYIPANDPHINRGDLRYEPRSALAAGLDGLEAIRRIAAQVPGRLKSGGLLALEHGFDQGPAVRGILTRVGLAGVMTLRDLAGHERVTLAERGPAASTGSCIGP